MVGETAVTRPRLLFGPYDEVFAACTYQQWGWCECVISDYVCSTDFFFFSAGCLKLSIAIQLYMTQK